MNNQRPIVRNALESSHPCALSFNPHTMLTKTAAATRLPPEILGDIFKLYLDKPELDMATYWDNAMRPAVCHNSKNSNSPLILGRVCSYWRAVAISTSALWTTIVLYSPRPRHIPLIKSWLERAGRRPLTIAMVEYGLPPNQAVEEVDQVVSTLVQYSPQWKKVVFQFYKYYPRPLRDIDPRYLLRLESALIWRYGSRKLGKIWSIFYQSPLLHEVFWDCHPPRLHRIPSAQLTEINCRAVITPDTFWDLITSCTYLRTLEVHIGQHKDDDSLVIPIEPMITHSSLKSLLIHFRTSATPFYDSLVLPSLVDFYAIHQYDYPPYDAAEHALFDMIVRSSCSLRKFSFEGYRTCEDVMLAILRLPYLRSVSELRLTYGTNAILSLLTESAGNEESNPKGTSSFRFMPELEDITCYRGYTDGTVLSDLLASRLPFLRDFYFATRVGPKFSISESVLGHEKVYHQVSECGMYHLIDTRNCDDPYYDVWGPKERLDNPVPPFPWNC